MNYALLSKTIKLPRYRLIQCLWFSLVFDVSARSLTNVSFHDSSRISHSATIPINQEKILFARVTYSLRSFLVLILCSCVITTTLSVRWILPFWLILSFINISFLCHGNMKRFSLISQAHLSLAFTLNVLVFI